MSTFLFDATKLLRPSLRYFVFCIPIILFTIARPALAEGTVQVLPAGFYLPGSPTWTGATPAAVCVAHPNFCGWAPGTLISSMTCGIVPGSAVYNASFCISYTEPIVPLSSCPPNSTGTPTQTNPTTCTCDAKFQPDAAGTSCVPVSDCPVTALSSLPANDACAQVLENTSSTQAQRDAACGALTPAIQSGKTCLQSKLNGLSIPLKITGDIRDVAYQAHLREIWDKMEDLVELEDDPIKKTACSARRAEIAAEKGCDNAGRCKNCFAESSAQRSHCLKGRPASPNPNDAQHTQGNAFDVSESSTIAPLNSALNNLRPPQTIPQFLDAPTNCNLNWGGSFSGNYDPIHFYAR